MNTNNLNATLETITPYLAAIAVFAIFLSWYIR